MGGVQSNFRVNPNLGCVELYLSWGFDKIFESCLMHFNALELIFCCKEVFMIFILFPLLTSPRYLSCY